MTLKRSKYTKNFVAQCDGCHEFVDFEDDQDFPACVYVLKASGWKASRDDDGAWAHLCSDCKKEN